MALEKLVLFKKCSSSPKLFKMIWLYDFNPQMFSYKDTISMAMANIGKLVLDVGIEN